MNDDRQLLLNYAEERSETAFAELVNRHLDMVYSAALRVVRGDTHLASDVAQIVFAELARKAATLPCDVLLAGWLYRCASFTAVKAVRSERRRREREQTAMQMIAQNEQTEGDWEQIAPEIDEALNKLSEADRNAILLRFLQRCDFRAVASTLGVSEDAAQKRVSRALEKLRNILRPAPAGAKWTITALASVLAADAVTAAPAGLASSIITTSL
ncbi:MAG TPA: sigma-70 family RNA polymerase sigma factor, partial [Candidatus Binatia bacterium]|nr:sigma-70 family RNA polymerase sigma factor [Candidatus Binatia bacterium]